MEKPSRPVRNRKRSRKAWPPGDTHRPIKRLFTPEIKRMLKDWLVRRRENPYPNREEKKQLACETGLTYTQICNWFANWRRKLKNSGHDPVKKTWGNLIKNYNDNAKGNVEQFSICSSDSIWGEYITSTTGECTPVDFNANTSSIIEASFPNAYRAENGTYYLTPSTTVSPAVNYRSTNKYKSSIMEKYLPQGPSGLSCELRGPPSLSKWLESTAKFTPSKNNYIDWDQPG
ncbi:conserved hypothetical protein [Culex quinquefasciatus]|uniref:Homeobox domain-containing protein n=1 Tax=Culex quinquefasciatus TaxID=7176 RepID=B0W713_CULQU|nr:conserved hypothetical protein [Culex quinquefasciatus]|eukprot:XP_001844497.1 conserved hypothetical protein [Culex quinquefasciatus]